MPPAKKAYRKKRVAKKKRAPRRSGNVAEYASLSERRSFTGPAGNTTFNIMYTMMNTALNQFTRAPQVARAYQFYRIKNIKLTIKPPFDTYSSEATTGYGKPFLYYMIDKAGAIPTTITLEGLKAMGAKPRALDEKPITITWAPSVLNVALTSGGPAPTSQGSAYKISPWLNTSSSTVDTIWNASSVDHLGLYWRVDSPNFSGTPPVYTVDVEVQFEFKKPLITNATGTVSAVPVQMAELNRSPDGIVGGDDDHLA